MVYAVYMICFDVQTMEMRGWAFASNLATQPILMRPHWTDSLKEVSLMLYEMQGEITDFMQN